MSIFQKIFGTPPTTTTPPVNQPPGSGTPQNQQQQDPNLGTQRTGQTDANGVVPKQEESPLGQFKDIWKNVPNPADNQKGVFGDINPQTLMEAAGKVDFSKVITPENLAAITAGGEGASKAFAQSLNQVAQTVYGQNAVATTKIVEEALAKQAERFQAQLPAMIKKFNISDSLRTENPIYSDPALQPIVSALENQLQLKNPTATQAEIKEQTNLYFEALTAKFNAPKAEAAAKKAKSSETDWDLFFES